MRTLNDYILEAKDPKAYKQEPKIIEAIYREISPYTSKIYRDEHWQGKNDIVDALGKFGETEVTVENGGYRKNKYGDEWKEWLVHLSMENNSGKKFEFDFMITAHQAGSVKDPWDAYDMNMTRQYVKTNEDS